MSDKLAWEQSASKAARNSSDTAKGSAEVPVSIATALREITAQWQANHGTQPARDTAFVCSKLVAEQTAQWMTQVMLRSLMPLRKVAIRPVLHAESILQVRHTPI